MSKPPLVSVILPVLVGDDPAMISLTELCIRWMRLNTKIQYELVLVETETRHFERLSWSSLGDYDLRVDKYVRCPLRTSVVKDHNAGLRAASGDYRVFTANDILVTPGWFEALLEPFDVYADCGLSSLSAAEPGAFIGPQFPAPLIVEGNYTPIMMFKREWGLDEAFPGGYSDSDLIMRIYTAGLRSYRNCRVQIFHLNHLTIKKKGEEGRREIAAGEELFYQRWGDSPLMMYAIIRSGGVVHGREHEFLRRPIVPYMQRTKEGQT